MLEFGFHCFFTPSENINDITRMFVLYAARYVLSLQLILETLFINVIDFLQSSCVYRL